MRSSITIVHVVVSQFSGSAYQNLVYLLYYVNQCHLESPRNGLLQLVPWKKNVISVFHDLFLPWELKGTKGLKWLET